VISRITNAVISPVGAVTISLKHQSRIRRDAMLDFTNASHLGTQGPMRVLSVSGGGLLGVIPAAMLVRYEALGKAAYGSAYRLSDSFDLVGGTSTGAVIATGVALGLGAEDIANFYLRDVPKGFRRRRGAIPLLHDLFDGDLLTRFYTKQTGTRRLERNALECHLAITVKDMSRGRPMMFSTLASPTDQVLDADIRNDALPLDTLLRASTAAPGLFSPVPLTLNCGTKTIAVDGGLSPYNDPGLLLSRLAANTGASSVDMIGLGTGSTRPSYGAGRIIKGFSVLRAVRALMGVIRDGERLTRQTLRLIAETPGSQLSYRHHDMGLDAETLEALGVSVSRRALAQLRSISDFSGKRALFDAALTHAERTISEPLPLSQHACGLVTV
jgi:hypothetical protein